MTGIQPYNNFKAHIDSVKDLLSVHALVADRFPALKQQADEILRAVIVLSVSALDNFIHDFVRQEIVESYLGMGNYNVNFKAISISIDCLKNIENAKSDDEKRKLLHDEIKAMHATNAYQSPKSIEYALKLLNIEKIWSLLESQTGIKAKDIRDELSLIIDRRNKISHESDYDYANFRRFPIDANLTNNVIQFIEKLVDGINHLA